MDNELKGERPPLNDLILELLEMPDIYSLLGKAKERMGIDLAFRYSHTARTITCSDSREFLGNAQSFPMSEIKRVYETHPVVDGTSPCGFIFLDRKSGGKRDPVLEALIIGLRFLFRREMHGERNKRLFTSRFFEDLLLNKVSSELELRKRGDILGIPIDEDCMVFLTSGLADEKQDFLLSRIKAFFRRTYFVSLKGMLVHIVFLRNTKFDILKESLSQVVNSVQQEISEYDEQEPSFFYFGAGSLRSSLLLLHESYTEAKSTLFFNILHKKSVIFWKEIGAFGLICSLASSKEADFFCSAKLGPLMEYDKMHKTNLLDTLSAIESCNWNLALAAEKLYFHYNTLKYRYGKLQQILNSDFKDSSYRFDLAFALRVQTIRKMQKDYE